MTDTNVRIGQWTAQGGEGHEGFFIETRGLKGLFSGPGVRTTAVERPQGHGEFDVPVFRTSRVVTISGKCHADSAERLDWYGNQLTGLLADGRAGRVVFDTPGGPRWADARLFDVPEFDPILWGSLAEYQIQVRFPNPRLFGEARTFGPARNVTAHHFGNFAASPVITVTGASAAGYTVWGPDGRKFGVTHPLVAGQPHVIDMASGLLRVGGQVVVGGVVFGQTWSIPPGVPVEMFTVDGSATLTVSVTDTFV